MVFLNWVWGAKTLNKQKQQGLLLIPLLIWGLALGGCNHETRNQAQQVQPNPDKTAQITVNGINVTDSTRREAESQLLPIANNMLNKQVKFTYQAKQFSASLRDLGASTNLANVLNSVYGNRDTAAKPETSRNLRLALDIDESRARTKVAALATGLQKPARDASFQFSKDKGLQIIPHVSGTKVDEQKAVAELNRQLTADHIQIPLAVKETSPQITTDELEVQRFDSLISSFTTSFNPTDVNRTVNLKKAAGTLNMSLIKPGAEFSFNTTVGPRTAANGYKEAPVIKENELTPDIGGGICQVSSTLYNVALLADLPILERHPHEFAIPYVSPGRDATVADKGADFRFKNNTPGFLLLKTEVSGYTLNMSLYGKKSNEQVVIKTSVENVVPFLQEKRIDSSLNPGQTKLYQKGANGQTVTAYRIVKVNGREVRQEKLSKDVYKPANNIVRVGPHHRGGAID